MHKIACDHPGCQNAKSVGGSADELWKAGWTVEPYFGITKALCPIHTKELEKFVGIRIETNPHEVIINHPVVPE